MRFKGFKIFKDDTGIERILKISFYFKDVEEIEEYTYDDYYKNTDPKVYVTVNGRAHVILSTYKNFDDLLTKFDHDRKVVVCN